MRPTIVLSLTLFAVGCAANEATPKQLGLVCFQTADGVTCQEDAPLEDQDIDGDGTIDALYCADDADTDSDTDTDTDTDTDGQDSSSRDDDDDTDTDTDTDSDSDSEDCDGDTDSDTDTDGDTDGDDDTDSDTDGIPNCKCIMDEVPGDTGEPNDSISNDSDAGSAQLDAAPPADPSELR